MRIALVIVAAALCASSAQAQGSISVCVTADGEGGRLPGSTVMIWGPQFKQEGMAQANGCYTVTGLPPGSYTAAAELGGFDRRKVTNLQVGASGVAEVHLALPVATRDTPRAPMRNVLEFWDLATWIVHGRIANTTTGPTQDSIRYAVTPLTVLSWYPTGPSGNPEVVFVQSGKRFRKGDEVIVLMKRTSYDQTPIYAWPAFVVKRGAIHPLYGNDPFDGMKVAEFIAQLRALAAE